LGLVRSLFQLSHLRVEFLQLVRVAITSDFFPSQDVPSLLLAAYAFVSKVKSGENDRYASNANNRGQTSKLKQQRYIPLDLCPLQTQKNRILVFLLIDIPQKCIWVLLLFQIWRLYCIHRWSSNITTVKGCSY